MRQLLCRFRRHLQNRHKSDAKAPAATRSRSPTQRITPRGGPVRARRYPEILSVAVQTKLWRSTVRT
jgi:hypothetical protein